MKNKATLDQQADKYGDPERGEDIDALISFPAAPEKKLQPSDMKAWLKQFKVGSRSSTVTNAFVAALLPHDEYDLNAIKEAMAFLGQDEANLTCVYCGDPPTTWDHLTNLVQDGKANPFGFGHRIYNLVPCCAKCNSSKGKDTFKQWILGYQQKKGWKNGTLRVEKSRRHDLVKLLESYQEKCPSLTAAEKELEEKLMGMRDAILAILVEADKAVAKARPKPKKAKPSAKHSKKAPNAAKND
ncbi:HNH endonuclease [Massilia sp. HP4]|uniref:HNH endonuclease n=1 Tax=Massilia sp. HP4 TaxID=2562316 RepID=UPI0010C096D2|nr:HNH endonuclease [Massilia sp. HP4]